MTDDDKKFVEHVERIAEANKNRPHINDTKRLCRIIRELEAELINLHTFQKENVVAVTRGTYRELVTLQAEIANAPWVYGMMVAGHVHLFGDTRCPNDTHRAPLLTSRMERVEGK